MTMFLLTTSSTTFNFQILNSYHLNHATPLLPDIGMQQKFVILVSEMPLTTMITLKTVPDPIEQTDPYWLVNTVFMFAIIDMLTDLYYLVVFYSTLKR